MGIQIIRETTSHRYALFSSETDTLIARNVTRSEIIAALIAAERVRIETAVARICDALDEGGKPYHQFTLTLAEAEALHAEHWSDDVGGVPV